MRQNKIETSLEENPTTADTESLGKGFSLNVKKIDDV